jgi:hypothetical protein
MKNNIHNTIYKKNSGFYLMVVFMVLMLAFSMKVSAEGSNSVTNVADKSGSETGKIVSPVKAPGNKEESIDTNENKKENEAIEIEATSSEREDVGGKSQGDEHKSRVASIVKDLLSVADRDWGIGEDVRIVAREQASTSEKVKKDMDEVDSESSLKVFFLGTNYKNTGDLRSTIVTTQNHIARLKKAEERTTSTTTKTDLEVQITELQKVASSTQAFIDANEGKFSLFGWFVRIFAK